MPTGRVFISSVIGGFEAERAAAQAAIESLRLQPVMAEDFGAKPYSPQLTCLEGVRSSQVFVAIFGPRYGYITQAGVSASEEEFLEARRRGLDILCFVQKGLKEPEQQAFLDRMKGYEAGYHLAFFETADQLALAIVRGLNDRLGHPETATLDEAAATRHIDRYAWGTRHAPQQRTWLGLVIFPSRQGEPYLSPLDLGRADLHDRLLQPALFGLSGVLRRELGIHTEEGEDFLAFQQHRDGHELVAVLEVHTDGTLLYGFNLDARDRSRFSWMSSSIINQDTVQQVVTGFLAYSHQFYQQLGRGELIVSLYLGLSVQGTQHKLFGRPPSVEPNSLTIPSSFGRDEPLHVPSQPMKVARADLATAPDLGEQLTQLLARSFRLAGTYYPPGS